MRTTDFRHQTPVSHFMGWSAMSPIKLIGSFLLCFTVPSAAFAADKALPPVRQLVAQLRSKSPDARAQAAEQLGFQATWGPRCLGEDASNIRVGRVTVDTGRELTTVIGRSEGCWASFLTLFSEQNGKSYRIATYAAASKYRIPSIRTIDLFQNGESEFIIDGDASVEGTGEWQYHILILQLRNNLLQAIFDEPKIINFSVPIEGGNSDQTEVSEFFVTRKVSEDTNTREIFQKQVMTDHKKKLVRYKRFFWNPLCRLYRSQLIDASTFAKQSNEDIVWRSKVEEAY